MPPSSPPCMRRSLQPIAVAASSPSAPVRGRHPALWYSLRPVACPPAVLCCVSIKKLVVHPQFPKMAAPWICGHMLISLQPDSDSQTWRGSKDVVIELGRLPLPCLSLVKSVPSQPSQPGTAAATSRCLLLSAYSCTTISSTQDCDSSGLVQLGGLSKLVCTQLKRCQQCHATVSPPPGFSLSSAARISPL